ncbi:hypothetical protein E2C01_012257 [Portunus trituberculatus]|uniref:Uncharacterized protein n=1 Tax=Portunus trituberculatus TaxID=210409 RepID=A0A5B7DDK5_PORTR|nr:hypothetical protein [Portunus trituberculatus]
MLAKVSKSSLLHTALSSVIWPQTEANLTSALSVSRYPSQDALASPHNNALREAQSGAKGNIPHSAIASMSSLSL